MAFSDDYEALTRGAGVVDIPRDVLRIAGPDALDYIQGQCSQDLTTLSVGSSVDALVLEPQGKLDALVRITRSGDEELFLDVAGGYGGAVKARLDRFKLRVKAEIEPVHWRCLAVRGANATERGASERGATERGATERTTDGETHSSTGVPQLVVKFSWNGLEGVDLLGETPEPPAHVWPCSADALESLRIEAGIPEMGSELDDRTIPAEAGLLDRCVSFTKGCYTGQELVARLDSRGNRVARRLRGMVLRSKMTASDVPALRGAQVEANGKLVGFVTSVAWSPLLGAVAALGYLHRDVVAPAHVELVLVGTGARVEADARELPFAYPS